MEEFNLLKKLERVKAPPHFEQKILAQLSLRKRQLKTRNLRLSLAGAFSAIIVLFIVVNIFILPQRSPLKFIGVEKGISSSVQERGPVIERDFILFPLLNQWIIQAKSKAFPGIHQPFIY